MAFSKRLLQCAFAAAVGGMSMTTQALNILISNDDGLTSNVKALYDTLTAAGHDVVVSVPCTNQSGRSGALVMYNFSTVSATNDAQAASGCRSGAAAVGDPAFGPMTKAGFNTGDYYYVHGTPVMATMYGIDVVAQAAWGKDPDLVLSGPNEGPNVGKLGTNSGTVGNVQMAAGRGIPAIALSAGSATRDDVNLAHPSSPIIAQLTKQLVDTLIAKAGNGPLLPSRLALTVNFPDVLTASTPFAFARMGTYELITPLKFRSTNPGYGASLNPDTPTAAQAEDESVVYRDRISVAAMQLGFEQRPAGQEWLRLRLKDLLQ
ncbi:MAG: 5'/3'-nucleotidase SurE [Spongiibacteraceae bacterium]